MRDAIMRVRWTFFIARYLPSEPAHDLRAFVDPTIVAYGDLYFTTCAVWFLKYSYYDFYSIFLLDNNFEIKLLMDVGRANAFWLLSNLGREEVYFGVIKFFFSSREKKKAMYIWLGENK